MRMPGAAACSLLCLFLASCQRADVYKAKPAPAVEPRAEAPAPVKPPDHWSWLPPKATEDIPIDFIASDQPGWGELREAWNPFPPAGAGKPTIHLGQSPVAALAAMAMVFQNERIQIKVPLGLPDPTPHIPRANPMTFGKWRLGQKIFFKPALKVQGNAAACATCHRPVDGFAYRTTPGSQKIDPSSLLNVVYVPRLFHDGRVGSIEETVVRRLEDEVSDNPGQNHRWGGLVQALGQDREMRREFERVFGIETPTQDAIAKALACYLRTLLSGNSVYDRANRTRQATQASEFTTAHVLPQLDGETLMMLRPMLEHKELRDPGQREQTARLWKLGSEIFFGRGRCASCHRGPLFTDQDFHNIGLGRGIPTTDSNPVPGREKGRFASTPIGLKEHRLIGAFRTPSLRSLAKTSPYFHDGSRLTLRAVTQFYDVFIDETNTYLAEQLKEGEQPIRLNLGDDEREGLIIFLLSLEGEPLDPFLTEPR